MTTYYRVRDAALRDLTETQYAELVANGKAEGLRVYVIDAQPTPSATEVVVSGGVVVGPVEARLTFALRPKTADELEANALSTERAQLVSWLADVQTQLDITNAQRAAMTANQRLNALENDTRVLLRIAKRYVRQEKRSLL